MMGAKDVYGKPITTPIGRISYPYVFERAKSLQDGKEGKYEITLLIPKSEDISALRKMIEDVARQAFGTKFQGIEKLKHPVLRDGDERGAGDPAYGHWMIRAKSAKRPLVVNPARSPIENRDDIYGGAWGRLNVTPASYALPTSWGVTLYLNAVQKVKDGERFGGSGMSAEEAFEALSDAAPESIDSDPHF